MSKYKVVHLKKDCISCGACAAITPNIFKMDEEGLAQLKGDAKEVEKGKWEKHLKSLDEKSQSEEAANVCPVSIIHVEEEED